MIKVLKVDNYNVKKHNNSFRRGFIVPIPGAKYRYSILNITDTENRVDHEKIADNFIYAKDDEIKNFVTSMGITDEETFNDMFNFIKNLQDGYERKKIKYPSSRKDYLIYEQDSIAYDSHSSFGQGAFVIYRDTDKQRQFYIDPFVEKLVYAYAGEGWGLQKAPKDPQKADDNEYARY